MSPRRFLVPIDLAACPLEIFPAINELAGAEGARIILLNVARVNVDRPENRLYSELAREIAAGLKRLELMFLRPAMELGIAARLGKPAEEIVQEAEEFTSVDFRGHAARAAKAANQRWAGSPVVWPGARLPAGPSLAISRPIF